MSAPTPMSHASDAPTQSRAPSALSDDQLSRDTRAATVEPSLAHLVGRRAQPPATTWVHATVVEDLRARSVDALRLTTHSEPTGTAASHRGYRGVVVLSVVVLIFAVRNSGSI